jgi:hypothetical protein
LSATRKAVSANRFSAAIAASVASSGQASNTITAAWLPAKSRSAKASTCQ